jgi:hypothetical protein
MTGDLDYGARFQELDKKLGRVRILALLAFLVGAGGFAYGLSQRNEEMTEGRLFTARDERGQVRALLGLSNDGVGLTMYDSTGQIRLDLGLAPGGVPGLVMFSPRGEPVATINLIEGRIPVIRLTNVADSIRVLVQPRTPGAVEVQAPERPDTMFARSPRK